MGRITAQLTTYDPSIGIEQVDIADGVPEQLTQRELFQWVSANITTSVLMGSFAHSSAPIENFYTPNGGSGIPAAEVYNALLTAPNNLNNYMQQNYGVDFISTSNNSLFQYHTIYEPQDDQAQLRFSGNRRGMRSILNPSVRYSNNSNTLQFLRSHVKKDDVAEKLQGAFAASRFAFCVGRTNINSFAMFVEFINRISCVPLALYLRYSRQPAAALIAKWLGGRLFDSNQSTGVFGYPLSLQGPDIIENILRGLFDDQDTDPWELLSKPVTDAHILNFCREHKVFLLMLKKNSLDAYRKLLDKKYETPGIVRDEDKYKRLCTHFKHSTVLAFCPEYRVGYNKNHGVVLWTSDTNHQDLHANLLLCPIISANILRRSPTTYVNMVTASATTEEIKRDTNAVMLQYASREPIVTKFVYDNKQLDLQKMGLRLTDDGPCSRLFVSKYDELLFFKTKVKDELQHVFDLVTSLPPTGRERWQGVQQLNEYIATEARVLGFDVGFCTKTPAYDIEETGEEVAKETVSVASLFEYVFDVVEQKFAGFFNLEDFALSIRNKSLVTHYKSRHLLGLTPEEVEEERKHARVMCADGLLRFSVSLTNPVSTTNPNTGDILCVSELFSCFSFDGPRMKLCNYLIAKDKIYQNTLNNYMKTLAFQLDKKAGREGVIKGEPSKESQQEVFDRLDVEGLSLIASRRNLLMDIVLDHPEMNKLVWRHMSSSELKQEEEVQFIDSSFDEIFANVSVTQGSLPYTIDADIREVDFTKFYTSILCLNNLVHRAPIFRDFLQETWVPAACTNPNKYNLTYVGEDYLSSYTFDSGSCFIEEVNWDYAMQNDDYRDIFTEHTSWFRFTTKYRANGKHLSRYVTTGSVIALCCYATKNILDFDDKVAVFKDIQKNVLGISLVKLNLTHAERMPLKYCAMGAVKGAIDKTRRLGDRVRARKTVINVWEKQVQKHVPLLYAKATSLIMHGEYRGAKSMDDDAVLPNAAMKFRALINSTMETLYNVTGTPQAAVEGARQEIPGDFSAKLEANVMIGQMKGDVKHGVQVTRVTDLLKNPNKDPTHLREWKALHCVFMPSQQNQLYTYNLPMYSARLVETVSVTPCVMRNTLRGFRNYILDCARTVMDTCVLQPNIVYATKVDAIYTNKSGYEKITQFLNANGFDLNKENQGMGPRQHAEFVGGVYQKARKVAEVLPWMQGLQNLFNLNDEYTNNEKAKEIIKTVKPVNAVRCSDLLDYPGDRAAKLEQHFANFWSRNKNRQLYDNYTNTCLKTMEKMGSFVLEGSPGCGKSRLIQNYLFTLEERMPDPPDANEQAEATAASRKRKRDEPVTVVIATATHATVSQFREFEQLDCVEFVGTIHSLAGVYNGFSVFKGDPRKHFSSPDTSNCGLRRNAFFQKGATVLILDEYEMLAEGVFYLLRYLKDTYGYDIILVGDRKQTAHFYSGMPAESDIVKELTNFNYIEADVQFRNPNKAFHDLHLQAVSDRPSLFLDENMSNYSQIDPGTDKWGNFVAKIADEYLECCQRNIFFRKTMVSTPNYKLGMYLVCTILDELCSLDPSVGDGCTWHRGTDIRNFSLESHLKNKHGMIRVRATDNPERKLFYSGCRMLLRPGMTYIVLKKLRLRVYEDQRAEERVRRLPFLHQGEYLLYQGSFTLTEYETTMAEDRDAHEDGGRTPLTILKFRSEYHGNVLMTMRDFEDHCFYPFCQYSGASVGHTYKNFYYFNLYKESARGGARDFQYFSLKRKLLETEKTFIEDGPGKEYRYTSEFVRSVNVAISRTTGNLANFVDVRVKEASFWVEYLKSCKHAKLHGVEHTTIEQRKAFVKECFELPIPSDCDVFFMTREAEVTQPQPETQPSQPRPETQPSQPQPETQPSQPRPETQPQPPEPVTQEMDVEEQPEVIVIDDTMDCEPETQPAQQSVEHPVPQVQVQVQQPPPQLHPHHIQRLQQQIQLAQIQPPPLIHTPQPQAIHMQQQPTLARMWDNPTDNNHPWLVNGSCPFTQQPPNQAAMQPQMYYPNLPR